MDAALAAFVGRGEEGVREQAEGVWRMLSDLARDDPDGYRAFVEERAREAELHRASIEDQRWFTPEPRMSFATEIVSDPERRGRIGPLFLNVCVSPRVPEGELGVSAVWEAAGGEGSVVDVAACPATLASTPGLPALALRRAEAAHGFVADRAALRRLDGTYAGADGPARQPTAAAAREARERAGRMRKVPAPEPEPEPVVSSTGPEAPIVQDPDGAAPEPEEYEVSVRRDGRACVTVRLPGVSGVGEVGVDVSETRVVVEGDGCRLEAELPFAVRVSGAKATFSVSRRRLRVVAPPLLSSSPSSSSPACRRREA